MKGLSYILELAFAAAAVVIDALRTFYLVVLSILGPVSYTHLDVYKRQRRCC